MSATAIVFAYHDVGVRCLSVLLAHGVDVRLVVTHRDNPAERIWFASVERLARRHGLEVITPDGVDDALQARVAALAPDFVFSFYYRSMLPMSLLDLAHRGALNLHGSLLPRYRGRVPVNWAVIHGERETGATLHYMAAKPDAGDIVDQLAVPILPDDTAGEVFSKVTVAAEIVLDRSLPALIAGTAPRRAQDLAAGSYFGGRRPEDGRIDWSRSARAVHDLVRGVAPPYPGAFSDVADSRLRILRTRRLPGGDPLPAGGPRLFVRDDRMLAVCGDGQMLELVEVEVDGQPLSAGGFARRYGTIRP
jgi:methionyl-tRNA formyltransferase